MKKLTATHHISTASTRGIESGAATSLVMTFHLWPANPVTHSVTQLDSTHPHRLLCINLCASQTQMHCTTGVGVYIQIYIEGHARGVVSSKHVLNASQITLKVREREKRRRSAGMKNDFPLSAHMWHLEGLFLHSAAMNRLISHSPEKRSDGERRRLRKGPEFKTFPHKITLIPVTEMCDSNKLEAISLSSRLILLRRAWYFARWLMRVTCWCWICREENGKSYVPKFQTA